jgi:hypothetical protein
MFASFAAGFVLPLFLLVMTLSFLIAINYPRSGVYAIIFLTFVFERFFTLAPVIIGKDEYKIYPLDIILLAVFAGAIFQIFIKREVLLDILKESKYLLIFMALSAVHFFVDIFFNETNQLLAFSSFKYYVFYPLTYFTVLILFRKKDDVMRIFKFALAGALGIIFFIFYGVIFSGGLWTEFTPLSTSGIRILAFTHAFYLSMAVLTLWIWILYKKKKSFILNILVAIWIVGVVGSMMRHLWLGVLLSIGVTYFLVLNKYKYFFKEKVLKYGVFIAFIGIAVFYISLIAPHYTATSHITNNTVASMEERVGSFFSIDGDESFSWRELVWKKSLREYVENPFWGLGLGREIYIEKENYRDLIEVRDIHNSWLALFLQVGPIAFIFMVVFVFKSIKNIDAFMDKDGLIRYVVGHFSFQSQAESLLKYIREQGFADAFVVNVNNEKKYTHKAPQLQRMRN